MIVDDERPISPGYQVFMLTLCFYALGVLAVQATLRVSPESARILDYADYLVCGIFFLDFVVSLVRAENRWRYLATWGWLDLLSSVPTVDVVRWGRAARVLRILRILRGLRATKLLATILLRRRAESSLLAAGLVALLLIIFCSIAVVHFEVEPDSNIRTAEDAIWWAFATITTVGYGDRFPVTPEGRFIAAILMCAGVGLFGTFSAFLAAWFLGRESTTDAEDPVADAAALRKEILALQAAVSRIESGLAAEEHLTDSLAHRAKENDRGQSADIYPVR